MALLFTANTTADMFQSSPGCFKPSKPYSFSDEYEYQYFMDEAETYQRCIENFVQDQQEAAQNHIRAAQEATEEWNRFVQFELQ